MLFSLWPVPSAPAAQLLDLEEQTRRIAAELRCPVCQNLSVADSPSELAQQMRAVINEQLREGKSPEQIKAYFISKYGDWVLLAPRPKGLSLVLWVLPFMAPAVGIALVLFVVRRWVKRKRDPQEQAPLFADLSETEPDYQQDHPSEDEKREETSPAEEPPAQEGHRRPMPRGLVLAASGTFLLLFGIAVGFFLNQSIRPRGSSDETITGGFLTGTGRKGESDLPSLLAEGRAAFEQQQWTRAIEVFKKMLAINPNHPEAHTYLGLILVRAGHADGALLAFERALESEPNFPLALWGKGMILYRSKGNLAGAQETFAKLVSLMPPGAERDEIQKTLNEVQGQQKGAPIKEKKPEPSGKIQGTVSVDRKLQGKADRRAVLFIIARAANSGAGPPLAVKRIDRPVFPVTYSLGAENVMIPGTQFTGKVAISARLDADGNPMTRGTGDLFGEHKKNPVEVGSGKIDIVIDQAQ